MRGNVVRNFTLIFPYCDLFGLGLTGYSCAVTGSDFNWGGLFANTQVERARCRPRARFVLSALSTMLDLPVQSDISDAASDAHCSTGVALLL